MQERANCPPIKGGIMIDGGRINPHTERNYDKVARCRLKCFQNRNCQSKSVCNRHIEKEWSRRLADSTRVSSNELNHWSRTAGQGRTGQGRRWDVTMRGECATVPYPMSSALYQECDLLSLCTTVFMIFFVYSKFSRLMIRIHPSMD
jgi:hypothetical protein